MSYPVTFEADYVERRNRLSAFFRLILAIPLAIWLYVYAIVAYIAIVIAWFAIVIAGAYPRGLYDFVAGFTRFLARVTAYAALLCDPYPSFGGSEDPAYPVRMRFDGPLQRYSRLKTLFRVILAIPIPDPALGHEPARASPTQLANTRLATVASPSCSNATSLPSAL